MLAFSNDYYGFIFRVTQSVELFCTYDSTVTEFIAKLSGDIPFESVENVMVDIKFAVDNLENAITKERDIDEKIVNILIHPEMGAVMHCEEHTKEMLSIE